MSFQRPWIFGEVLFDYFPDGSRVLGGAPFNVAWHLQALGQRPFFFSRIGDDGAGRDIRRAMSEWRMDVSGLQVDEALPSGRVAVTLTDGDPRYTIEHPAAWDRIEPVLPQDRPRLLYHGTLALRDPVSSETLFRLRKKASATVLVDVNLRNPWWEPQQVLTCVQEADWVKLNQEELDLLAPGMGARGFLEEFGLSGLVVTRGEQGAECLVPGREAVLVAPRERTQVVDTVGAGDALTAILICGLLNDWPVRLTLDRAQAFASAICGRRGATVRDERFYQAFLEHWQEDEHVE